VHGELRAEEYKMMDEKKKTWAKQKKTGAILSAPRKKVWRVRSTGKVAIQSPFQ
jgi:hypothetical protein